MAALSDDIGTLKFVHTYGVGLHSGSLVRAFGHFLSLYHAGGRRTVPETDGELHADPAAARKNRPAIAISGTPDQIVGALEQTLDATGVRRLLVETFSREEARLFAEEVIPVLKKRNATSVAGR